MSIPSNLLPISTNITSDVENVLDLNLPTSQFIETGVPNNLLRVNTSEISASFQSLAGNLPSLNAPQIPKFAILNTVIPESLFATGSFQQVRDRATRLGERYVNGLPRLPQLPTIPSTIPALPPRPSYGDIKNFIKIKIDRIKVQRQKASVSALREEIKRRENPFTYRQELKNQNQRSTVLGRFNNQ